MKGEGRGGVLNGQKLKLTKIVASGLECKGEPWLGVWYQLNCFYLGESSKSGYIPICTVMCSREIKRKRERDR